VEPQAAAARDAASEVLAHLERSLQESVDAEAAVRRLSSFRVLVDRAGLAPLLERPALPPPAVDAAVLAELTADVWYHALWTAKKLRRGEVWVARACVDCYLQAKLVELAALHARTVDPAADAWHGGRFLERWADERAVDGLRRSLTRDRDDVPAAIRRSVELFDRLADETAQRLGVTIAQDLTPRLRQSRRSRSTVMKAARRDVS
jgi:Streptomycin adenylyltransferase